MSDQPTTTAACQHRWRRDSPVVIDTAPPIESWECADCGAHGMSGLGYGNGEEVVPDAE